MELKTKIVACFLAAMCTTKAEKNTWSIHTKTHHAATNCEQKRSGEGSIVIIDNDLVVTAPSVTQAISSISIKNISDESETEVGGCFENKCMYSFSSYPKGTYLITVYSDSGNFWGYVTK